MARIRSIKPTFAGDSKVARLTLPARLTFLLLLPEADDEGRMVGSSKRIVGALYPNDNNIGPTQLEKWIRELEAEEMVERYVVDGTKYLAITNFRKHQNPQHPTPSALPGPPEIRSDPHERLMNGSRNPPEEVTKPSSLSVEGVERELRGSGRVTPASAPSAARSEADRIVREWWESKNPRPVAKFIGVVKIVERFIEAGHFSPAIAQALHDAPTPTIGALEFQLNKPSGTNGSQPNQAAAALAEWRRRADEAEARAGA